MKFKNLTIEIFLSVKVGLKLFFSNFARSKSERKIKGI
jgi:hypothetical protein